MSHNEELSAFGHCWERRVAVCVKIPSCEPWNLKKKNSHQRRGVTLLEALKTNSSRETTRLDNAWKLSCRSGTPRAPRARTCPRRPRSLKPRQGATAAKTLTQSPDLVLLAAASSQLQFFSTPFSLFDERVRKSMKKLKLS